MAENQEAEEFKITSRKKIFDQLDEIDAMDKSIVLPSSVVKPSEEKRKSQEEEESDSEWLSSLSSMPPLHFNKKLSKHLLDGNELEITGKKGKKKKKEKNGLTDYSKQFQREMSVLERMLMQQTEFADGLQTRYDCMQAAKSSARGVGKFQTDLISNVNSARSLTKDILKEMIALKKTISELTMKEKKELGMTDGEDENLGAYASNLLRQIISKDRNALNGNSVPEFEEVDNLDDCIDEIASNLDGRDDYMAHSDEANRFLKYEGTNVTVKCFIHPDETFDFIAFDDDDNVIPDYPVPDASTKININRETGRVRDEYNNSYEAVFE